MAEFVINNEASDMIIVTLFFATYEFDSYLNFDLFITVNYPDNL
jgi:hypothetical protein